MMALRIRLGLATIAVGLLVGAGIVMVRRGGAAAPSDAAAVAADARIVLSSDRLDFGDGSGGAVVRQVILRNGGSAPAHVRIESEGDGFVVDPLMLDLAAGQIGRVSVTAGPRSGGVGRGELRIFADGSDAPLRVALSGGASLEAPTIASEDFAYGDSSDDILPPEASRPSGDAAPVGATSFPTTLAGVEIARAAERSSDSAASIEEGTGEPVDRASSSGTPPSYAPPVSRSISDPPSAPRPDDPPRDGERPEPIDRKPVKPSDPSQDPQDPPDPPEPTGTPTFVISQASTLTLLGSANQFYPQNVGVSGSATGGSFRLASSLALPRVPLAFGQSMVFNQNGAAGGSFDPTSGVVTLEMPVQAVDMNGNAAPFVLSMTTGTVLGRNSNGVLISVTGQPRTQGSGTLRLVGIGKIPTGYRNGAEEQFVTVQMTGSLTFPDTTSAEVPSGSSGGGN